MQMRAALAHLVLAFGAADAGRGFVPPRRVVEEVVEHCVSSRWGFTCLTPRNAPPKILDVLVAKAKADASMMARFAGRSMIGVTAGWLSYETYVSLRDMRNYPSSAFDATLPQARRTRIATAPPRQRRGGGGGGGSGGGVLGWRAARQQARPRAGLLGRSRAPPPKPRGMSILSRADFL